MKLKRILLVLAIILIFSLCIGYMNMNYDSLSRYPYENEESREIIRQHLNTDEIEYIIEYSIAPSEFIEYIDSDSFNIYHADTYRYIDDVFWYLDADEVVSLSERLLQLDKVEEAVSLSDEYYYNEIIYYLENGDEYNPDSVLVENPNSISAYLDESHTVTIRNPYPLVEVDFMDTADKEIYIRKELAEPLIRMLEAMKDDLSYRYTGNLYMVNGYVSYDYQKELYLSGESSDMPGHSEHQLGLAIDLDLKSGDFITSRQYKWLKENAYKYGFIIDDESGNSERNCSNHLRFIGYDDALIAYENGLTLKEVLNK